ncbi:917_t:CDS:2 [Scutellospora calospora]|uniref:917_t:CDS:1 n=1 Tax=Scutellospora calospora TaxID=85575 RepID=A0ACA9L4A9_9GLOM|nr:917_t:CDS:2 [Scutellospora calospora]
MTVHDLNAVVQDSCATADRIEWRRIELWSKVSEFMCDDIKIPYKIIEELVEEKVIVYP